MEKITNEVLNKLKEMKTKSEVTYTHLFRVANLCVSFGKILGLSNEEIEKLRIGGLLHDIGKLDIDDDILNKPSRLTREEYEIIKKHTTYGKNLLKEMDITDKDVVDLVLHHHERLDGLGYPSGLKEDSISKLTKILTICDCYDAMSSKREYKDAYDMDFVKKELIRCSKTQFDQELVNIFIENIDYITKDYKFKKNF